MGGGEALREGGVSQYNRKYDGPPVREIRQADQDPARYPPHRKPRKYKLTLKYETVTHETLTKEFTSKAAMQEFRGRAQCVLEKRRNQPKRKNSYNFAGWRDRYELKMDSEEHKEFKAEPVFTEEMIWE